MPEVPRRLYGPAAMASAATTVYTVPTGSTVILRYIRFSLSGSTDRSVTFSIGPAATVANQLFSAFTVPANAFAEWTGFIPLNAGEILQAYQTGGTDVSLIIAAIEQGAP